MKTITIVIDLSGKTRDCHGSVEETPKISMSATGLNSEGDTKLSSDLMAAVRKIVAPNQLSHDKHI